MPVAVVERDTYVVSVSALSVSSITCFLVINNNSASTVRLNAVTYKPATSAALTGSAIMVEGYRLSSSSTGGTNVSANLAKMDTNSPNIPEGLSFYYNATVTTSGGPMVGGSFFNDDVIDQKYFHLYHYRGCRSQDQLILRPNQYFALLRAPGTGAPRAGIASFVIEFTVGAT